MNWIELIVYVGTTGLLFRALLTERKERKANVLFLADSLKQAYELMGKQSGLNMNQARLNSEIANNLEILGVHTQLIEPSIGFEATAFLAWHNNTKEEDNG